ncbi:MAG: hypothetical protein IH827_05870 [Myxococcales bacterium]|nr:hypothetical protein [Myxococcales bacterium]
MRVRIPIRYLLAIATFHQLLPTVQADEIEPEPYFEEEVEPEPEPEVEEETETASESNGMTEKIADAAIIRPLYFARLVAGLPFFVFYPLTMGSGWSEDVVTLLWTEPFDETFRRPLGQPPGDY